jgi:hypothetical protein
MPRGVEETISPVDFFEPFGGEHRCLQGIEIGTRDHDKVAYGEELRIVLPGLDLQEGVGAHDKKEPLTFFEVAMVVGDSLDGVGCPLSSYLYVGEGEAGVAGDSYFDHVPAVSRGDDGAIKLVGWRCSHDEDHPVELEGLMYFLGRAEMAQVDGIKGPTKEPYPPLLPFRRS